MPAASLRTLLLALLALLVLAVPASASRTMTTSFEAPRDLLDPSTRTQALDEIQSLGVDSLRVVMLWQKVAPEPDATRRPDFNTTDPDAYDWGQYDALLTEAKQRGMDVLLTVSGPVPRWATEDKKDNVTRPNRGDFAQFMTAVGRHFADRVDTWSVWNEPNQPQFLQPQYDSKKRPVSGRLYRALYKAALKGLRSANVADPEVLFGETSPRGTGKVVAPLTFLRQALCLDSKDRRRKGCGKLPVDGIAHHAYTTREGPRFVPAGPNDVTIGVLNRLTRLVNRAGASGAIPKRLPLHLTEFGIQSTPDPIFGVFQQRQDEFRNLSERIAYYNPRVATFSQYLLRDDRPDENATSRLSRYPGFESGLRTSSGRDKQAYDSFRLVLSALRRSSRVTTLWGLVRPAGRTTTAVVEYRKGRRGSWRKLKTVRTNTRGFYNVRTRTAKGRQYRLTWQSPSGETFTGGAIRPLR